MHCCLKGRLQGWVHVEGMLHGGCCLCSCVVCCVLLRAMKDHAWWEALEKEKINICVTGLLVLY